MTGTANGIVIDGTPTNGANPLIDSLVWGGAWENDPATGGTTGPVTISYAAMQGTDPNGVFAGQTLTWTAAEIAELESAFAAWEAVANIDFVEAATSDDADVWIWKTTARQASGYLGWSDVPATLGTEEPLYVALNGQDESWSTSGLAPGGYGYVTLIHELGHLIGLAHPHDGGSRPDGQTFPGVTEPFGDYGQYDLNQGIFTTMSYNDGWATEYPDHGDYDYGWQATPMALDIAAIQAIYGPNMSYRTGNDSYQLPSVNAAGTFWSCLWDAGGKDLITNAGSDIACVINLKPAPLTGPNAGGYVSYAPGIVGGYTIANGVVIENATGGKGADDITGNSADNQITGGGGNDTLTGGHGDDHLLGSGGKDLLKSGAGQDRLEGGAGDDTYVTDGADRVVETADGGTDTLKASGTAALSAHVENLTLTGDTATDGTGNALANRIVGNSAANTLAGASGNDTLTGGSGPDTFVFDTAFGAGNRDTITDFRVVDDTIRLDDAIFAGLKTGVLSADAFAQNTSGDAADRSDRIIYESDTGKLFFDKDGTGSAAKVQFATLDTGLTLTNADFFVV